MTSIATIENHIDRRVKDRMEKLTKILVYAGEKFVQLARDNGDYRDITGNLRSSIGYVVLNDGEVIKESFKKSGKGSDKATGVMEARVLADDLAQTHNKGLVLIGMAGMDYALSVENINGKDVISSSEVIAKELVDRLLKKALDG